MGGGGGLCFICMSSAILEGIISLVITLLMGIVTILKYFDCYVYLYLMCTTVLHLDTGIYIKIYILNDNNTDRLVGCASSQ